MKKAPGEGQFSPDQSRPGQISTNQTNPAVPNADQYRLQGLKDDWERDLALDTLANTISADMAIWYVTLKILRPLQVIMI
jgi:hypothetical protein